MAEFKGIGAFVEHLHKADKEGKMNNLGKTPYDLVNAMRKMVPKTQEKVEMTMLKIRSNFARGRVVSFGDIHISFNDDGLGKVPATDREAVEAEMVRRPGRFFWEVEPEPVKAVAEVKPTEVVPEEIEVQVESLEEEMTAVLEQVEEQVSEVKKPRKSKK